MARISRFAVVATAVTALLVTSAPLVSAAPVGSMTLLVTAKRGVSAHQVVTRNGGSPGRAIDRLGIEAVTVPAGQASAYLKKYGADRDVAHVELQHSRRAASIATDPSYGDQWALPKIGWEDVHGVVAPVGTATIAVLDTGVATNADVSLVPGWSAFGGDATDDPNGHGTALASIAAATTDDERGIAGVAYSGVSVMPVQVLGSDGTGTDADVIDGIVHAADAGADVILMGFSNPGYSQALQDAVDYAWSKGAVLVAATGNDGSTSATFPAGDAKVVGVSATDATDALASFSNSGADTFLGAPGVDIATGSGSTSGTSASAAIVAGAAAELRANDGAANDVVVGRLARNADPASTAADTGNGRVNLARALADTSTVGVTPAGAAGNGGPFVGPYVIAANFAAILQGQSSGSATYVSGNLTGWQELQDIPMRVHITNAGTNQVIRVDFDHTKTAGGVATPGIQSLSGFTASGGVTITSPPVLSSPAGTDMWSYTFSVTSTSAGGEVTFTGRMAAGAHNFSGSALSLGGSPSLGTLQIAKPLPAAGSPDLALSKSAPGAAAAGTAITYTLSYQNKATSASTATGVQLTDQLPSNVTYVANSCTGCTVNGSQLIWDLGNLAAGATGSKTFQATIVAGTANGTIITNNASILSSQNDANASDNSATATTTVSGNPSISGTIYNDADGSGSFTAGELGIANVAVTLSGTSSGSTLTDANGNYSFINLTAGGTYNVNYTLPSGFTATSTKPVTGIVLSAGQDLTQNFFAQQVNATLSGSVYNDTNGNGAFDGADTGLSGVTVTRSGTGTTTATTNASGLYTFSSLTAGTYSVTLSVPTGYAATSPNPLTGIVISAGGSSSGNNFFVRRQTTTSVVTSGSPSTYGDSVTFTATVASAAGNPSGVGTVTFTDGLTTLCSAVALSGNTATCSTSALTAATHSITATYSGTSTAPGFAGSASTAVSQVVNPKSLTVTANDRGKTYGTAVSFAGTEFTASGLVNGDTVTSVTLTSAGAPATATVAGSPYAIVPSGAVGTGLGNYTLGYVNGGLTVGTKSLTITANNLAKDYGDAATFTGTEFSAVGLVNSDAVTSVTLTSAGAPATATVAGSPYAIVPSGAVGTGLGNYTLGYVNGSLTVGTALLTVTPDATSKTYGDGNPSFTYTITGFQNGEDADTADFSGVPSCSSAATAATPVGTATITCAIGTLSSSNYSFAFGTADLTINPRTLTVTAKSRSKTYGDTVTFAGTEFTTGAGQLVNGDTVTSVTLASSGAAASATVAGSPYAVTPSAAVGSGLGNYDISYVAGHLTVDAKGLTVTANDRSKTYGATLVLGSAAFTTSGLTNSDAVTSVTLSSAGAAATATVAGSPYAVTPSAAVGSGLGNYDISYVAGHLTVDAKGLTVTANDRSKTYGATLTLGSTAFTTSGLTNSDSVASVTLSSAGAAPTATVAGSPYAVTPSAAVGSGLGNYDISYVAGSLTVDPKGLTVTANDRTKTYGDTVTFAGTEFTTSGLTNSDMVDSVTLSSAGAAPTATVAGSPYAITPSAAVGSGLGNYDISYVDGNLKLDHKALTVTADNRTKTYGDTVTFAGTEFTTSGLVNSDAVTSATITSAGAAATATVAGSPYTIVISNALGSGLGNYTIGYTNGSLTVKAKTLTITADDRSKTYGDSVTFAGTEFTTSGLTGSDSVDSVTLASDGASDAATFTSPGPTYDIVPSAAAGTGLANYEIAYVNGTLTVDQRALDITADDQAKTYGNTFSFAGTEFTSGAGQLVNGDVVDGVTLNSLGSPATARVVAPGPTYAIHASAAVGTGLGNYAISYHDGTLTVGPRTLTVTAKDQSKTYGDVFSFDGTEFTTSGLTNGDSIDSVSLSSAGAPATAAVAGSPYAIVPSAAVGSGLGNYTIGYVNGGLTVGHKTLTITANDRTKTYGGALTLGSTAFTTSGLTNTDSVDSVTLSSAGAAGTATVSGSPYAIVPSAAIGSGLDNYTISYVNGALTVQQRTLDVTANSRSKTYGTAMTLGTAAFTTGGGQLVNGDTVTGVTLASDGAAAAATVTTPGPTYGIHASAATGTGLGNYAISYHDGTLTVCAKALTVTANDRSKTYGDTLVLGTTAFTTSELVNGDTVTSVTLTSAGAAGTAAVAGSPYAVVPSAASGNGLGNYSIGYVNGSLAVAHKGLTVTANDRSKTYGDTVNFAGTEFTTSGLVNGDTVTSVTLASAGAAGTATVSGSPYAIVPSAPVGTGLDNYTIGYANGSLTVQQRTLDVTANSRSKTYGTALTLGTTAFTTGGGQLVNGDTVTGATLTSDGAAATAVVTTPGPTYAIHASNATGTGLGNYAISYHDGSLTVCPKGLTVTANNRTKTYGDTLVLGTTAFTTSGLVNSDSVTSVALNSAGAASSATVAGSPYAIVPSTASGNGLGNYTIGYANGSLTVYRALLTATPDSKSKVFGTSDPAGSATLSGFVNGENAVSAGVTGAAVCTPGSHSELAGTYPGVYTCTTGNLAAANYWFYAGTSAGLTITQASTTTTVTVTPGTVQYSDQATLSAHVAGTVGGSALAGSVTFSIAGEPAIAAVPIDGSGNASTTVSLTGQATPLTALSWAKSVVASFGSTNANYYGSTTSGSVTEALEDVALTYTGDALVSTGSTSATSAPVSLSVALKEAADGFLGNKLGTTSVRFDLYKSSNTTQAAADYGCTASVSAPTAGLGTAACAPMTLPMDNYVIKLTLLGNGYYTSPVEDAAVTVAQPGTGFTTGGGWILEPSLGTKSNLGFTVKYQKNGSAQGNSLYIYRVTLPTAQTINGVTVPAGAYNWIIKANAMTALNETCSKTTPPICTAAFTGKSNVTAVSRSTGLAYSLGGNRQFEVDVTDNGEPGSSASTTPDTYAIRVWDSSGTYYQIGTPTAQVALNGGNIQVRP